MKRLLFFITSSFILSFTQYAFAETASAPIRGTTFESSIEGMATFTESPEGLKVLIELKGIPPGKHGLHIHEKGDCSDQGNAAGSHFNPEGAPHGLLMKDGFAHAHAGDLGNIEIARNGTGKLDVLVPGLTLKEGKYSVLGKAVILHEKEDDFGQPTGNAGGRIGCGVIIPVVIAQRAS